MEEIVKKALGLSVIFVGIKGALDGQRVLLLIMSMVCGAALGELVNIDGLMTLLGGWAERRLGMKSEKDRSFSKGFVSASVLFCGGSMATVGSMQSGLMGNHEILFAKSVLDGVTSIVFGATMGIGVVFSAIPVFIYQAGIALGSIALKNLLTPDIIREMSAVGSLIVAAIGFNFLGVKEIKVANFIPAMFIPLVYISIERVAPRFF
jgi:uncharacterized membrane protein YqgA involved in biofilm formation